MLWKVGARIHDLLQEDSENLVEELKNSEVETAQLTLPKFLSGEEPSGGFSLERLKEIKEIFDAANVTIRVLSCYINPLAEDSEAQQKKFKRYVDYAAIMGVKIVGTETGTVVSDLREFEQNHTEENFERLIAVMSPLIEYASSKGVSVGIETVKYFPVCDAKRFDRFLQSFPKCSICGIFDPTNLLYAGNYQAQWDIFEEFVAMHAKRIEVVHLKDFVREDGILKESPLFSGLLDVDFVIALLKKYNVKADVMIEGAPTKTAFKTIKNKLKEIIKRGV